MTAEQELLAAGCVALFGVFNLICYWLNWTEFYTWVDPADRLDGIPDEQLSHDSALMLAKWTGIVSIGIAYLVFLKHSIF